MENVGKLTQSATTESELGHDREKSWQETWKISAKCDIENEFENNGKLSQSASTEKEGTLRSEDGDGRENVAEKVNSRSFSFHRGYSKSLTLSNVGESSKS